MKKKKSIEKHSSIKKSKPINYWAISTAILAILLVATFLTSSNTGAAVSPETAGQKVLDFANEQGADATLISSTDDGSSLYKVTLSIDGQEVPVYVTKDGKTLVPQPIPLEKQDTSATPSTPSTPTPENIPKSDKPSVELYVWGYCPYGVQAQGPLSEVAKLLENSADFTIVPYHDGHGPFETQQNKIQSCIQKLDKAKYWDYAAGFVANVYPTCSSTRDIECDKSESIKIMDSLGIDSDAIFSCVEKEGEALFNSAISQAQANGVTGSPTVIINGVKADVGRDAESYKTAICSAYNNAPAECGETLSVTAATTPVGNC